MHSIAPLANLSGLALVLSFGTSALAQDIIADAQVGAAVGDGAGIVITGEGARIFVDVLDGAESKPGSQLTAGANNNKISGEPGNGDTIINILVSDDSPGFGNGTAQKSANFTAGADLGSEVQGSEMIAVSHGNGMSEAAVSESGTKMMTIQEFNTAVTADAITLETMPEMTVETGSVSVNENDFHGGVRTMTITSAPTNAVINNTAITMNVKLTRQ